MQLDVLRLQEFRIFIGNGRAGDEVLDVVCFAIFHDRRRVDLGVVYEQIGIGVFAAEDGVLHLIFPGGSMGDAVGDAVAGGRHECLGDGIALEDRRRADILKGIGFAVQSAREGIETDVGHLRSLDEHGKAGGDDRDVQILEIIQHIMYGSACIQKDHIAVLHEFSGFTADGQFLIEVFDIAFFIGNEPGGLAGLYAAVYFRDAAVGLQDGDISAGGVDGDLKNTAQFFKRNCTFLVDIIFHFLESESTHKSYSIL